MSAIVYLGKFSDPTRRETLWQVKLKALAVDGVNIEK